MDRDLVLGQWRRSEISVNVYSFKGKVLFNESVEEYYNNTLSLIDKNVRYNLFHYNHPVYTRVRDRVPSYYGEGSNVESCIVADGCMLEGSVADSVLFRQVSIKPGAQVEQCVIMNDSVVGENSYLKCVILDKDVVVRPGTKLIGTPSKPIIVRRGEVV
jgi:glucose-1-phosphate adenylyltransferase